MRPRHQYDFTHVRDMVAAVGTGVDELRALCLDMAAEITRLRRDELRMDWLAHPDNQAGQVLLPRDCVEAHPDDMRAAIDTAMARSEG